MHEAALAEKASAEEHFHQQIQAVADKADFAC